MQERQAAGRLNFPTYWAQAVKTGLPCEFSDLKDEFSNLKDGCSDLDDGCLFTFSGKS